jgi:hypothetical protein
MEYRASIALPTGVPAGFLYFPCTYDFTHAAVEVWQTDRQTDRHWHPIRPFSSKSEKNVYLINFLKTYNFTRHRMNRLRGFEPFTHAWFPPGLFYRWTTDKEINMFPNRLMAKDVTTNKVKMLYGSLSF